MDLLVVSHDQGRVPVTVFHLQERVNMGNYQALEETAKDFHANGMQDLVIDLGQTESLTSIGIRAIIAISKLLSTEGTGHVKLANPTPHIREVLDIAGVSQYIEIYDTVEEAVASF